MKSNDTVEMTPVDIKEKVLEEFGCVSTSPSNFAWEEFTYTYWPEAFLLSKIDIDKSLEVQVRCGDRLSSEYVQRYTESLKRGDKFPSLVIFKDSDENYLLADGNHTVAALLKLGVKKVRGVYLFTHPKPKEVASVFNIRTTGNGENQEEAGYKALCAYLDQCDEAEANGDPKPTVKSVAATYRLTSEYLSREIRIHEGRTFLSKHNIEVSRIPDKTTFDQISSVMNHSKPSALNIGKLAADFRLSNTTVKNIVADYNDSNKTEAQKEECLKEYRRSLKYRTNNGVKKVKGGRRSPEVILKDSIIRLAIRIGKADEDKIKKMTKDKQLSSALSVLSDFVKSVR